jgi:hypothetical protein
VVVVQVVVVVDGSLERMAIWARNVLVAWTKNRVLGVAVGGSRECSEEEEEREPAFPGGMNRLREVRVVDGSLKPSVERDEGNEGHQSETPPTGFSEYLYYCY